MRAAGAGLISGCLVLGVGGRILMRVLAMTTSEAPRFTWEGSLQVVVVGACWGAATAPLLVVLDRWRPQLGALLPVLFGLGVLVLAALALAVVLGVDDVVAPLRFIVLSLLLFPGLFLLHGQAVAALCKRGRK